MYKCFQGLKTDNQVIFDMDKLDSINDI